MSAVKICFFNSGFLPDRGGVATFAAGLVSRMAKHPDVDAVKVIAFKNTNPRHEIDGLLEIFAFSQGSFWVMFWVILKYTIRFRQFDIFHASNIFPVGFFVVLFAKFLFGKKVFLTLHGTDVVTTRGSALVKWAKRFTLAHADRALANSKSTMARAVEKQKVSADQFAVVYPGVDDQLFSKQIVYVRKQYKLNSDDFVVLTICQLIKRKGVDDLLRAIGEIGDKRVKLLVVGKGPETGNLKALAAELNIQDRVIFAGSAAYEFMSNYYQAADVFAMTSKYIASEGDIEGLGIVLLEAQYFGLPVIGTNSGGIPETIQDGKTGLIAPEADPEAIAAAVLKLKNNPEARRQMGETGKKFVRENFAWEKSIANHLKEYGRK